jgi:hypothetical protein
MNLLEYRLRPKSDYIIIASWEKVYSLSAHWKNNLSFYEDELHFLAATLSLKENHGEQGYKTMKQLLADLLVQVRSLLHQTDLHLVHLGRFIKNPREADASGDLLFREEHNVLEDNIVAFEQALRQTKEKLFKLAGERVVAATG